jgi:hypothetical protein
MPASPCSRYRSAARAAVFAEVWNRSAARRRGQPCSTTQRASSSRPRGSRWHERGTRRPPGRGAAPRQLHTSPEVFLMSRDHETPSPTSVVSTASRWARTRSRGSCAQASNSSPGWEVTDRGLEQLHIDGDRRMGEEGRRAVAEHQTVGGAEATGREMSRRVQPRSAALQKQVRSQRVGEPFAVRRCLGVSAAASPRRPRRGGLNRGRARRRGTAPRARGADRRSSRRRPRRTGSGDGTHARVPAGAARDASRDRHLSQPLGLPGDRPRPPGAPAEPRPRTGRATPPPSRPGRRRRPGW